MKRGLLALAFWALLVGRAAGETVLERASRLLHTPGTETASSTGTAPSQININYTIVLPQAAPWLGYGSWPSPPCAYPYPPYPPPASYWYAQVPLAPRLGAGLDAYPSPAYIYPSFRSSWAYGPTYIPSPGQVVPWYIPRPLPRRQERREESPGPAQPSPRERGQEQEPAKPTVVQAAQESGEETISLPAKRLALETSPRRTDLAIEALGNRRVKATWSPGDDSELQSVEIGLLSPHGQVLDSTSMSKPPYSAALRGNWREVRLRLILRFRGGGVAEFTLPLKEKRAELEQASR